ncbi:MAG: MotA/TolQ/ExbB proton channel family protein [Nitrospira sp.]|nr:MotA/TolQ/ExbB proton channel family protein [Candidatus Manganitrophaceae bacterium]HIL34843.1 MotA/TolQ/ExbB proton channel family protein [Candidatus Manganitrophaceae bacterium]
MNTVVVLIQFYREGGIFMYPLVGILAISTAIVLERFIVLMRSSVNTQKLWDKVATDLRSCTRSNRPLGQVIGAGIGGMKDSLSREGIQDTMDEAAMEVMPRLEARLHYLPNLANVATLLGLLGTIIGLIQAFTAVAVADPSQKATLLAKGISMAMNTTAFGLVVAIPIMLIYSFLQVKTNRILESLDIYALKLLNLSSRLNIKKSGLSSNGGKESKWRNGEAQRVKGEIHAN